MITGLNHLTFTTRDLNKSIAFYRDVLGLAPVCRWKKGAYFRAGDLWFCLNVDHHAQSTTDATHAAFSVSAGDFDEMAERILQSGAEIWQENISEGQSLYFCDPDGHRLEIHVGDLQSRMEHFRENPPTSFQML